MFAEEVDNCGDKDLLNQIAKKVKASHYLYTTLQKQEKIPLLTPTITPPANKNVDSFNKKRKENKKNNVRFAKPNQNDVYTLFTNAPNG